MKTLHVKSYALLCIAATMIASGCSIFDKADDVSFNAPLERSIVINKDNEGVDVTYSETIIMDATDNAQVNKYKDKIKEFRVNKITYQITNYNGDFSTIFNGSIAFGSLNTTPIITKSISNLDIKAAYQAGTEVALDLTQADADKIAALLKTEQKVQAIWVGTLSKTPVEFTIKLLIDADIKADALK